MCKPFPIEFTKGQKFILKRYVIMCNEKTGRGIEKLHIGTICSFEGKAVNPITKKPWMKIKAKNKIGIINVVALIGFDYSQDYKKIKKMEK